MLRDIVIVLLGLIAIVGLGAAIVLRLQPREVEEVVIAEERVAKRRAVQLVTVDGRVETKAVEITVPEVKLQRSTKQTHVSNRERLVLGLVAGAGALFAAYFTAVFWIWFQAVRKLKGKGQVPKEIRDRLDKAVAAIVGIVVGFLGGASVSAEQVTQTLVVERVNGDQVTPASISVGIPSDEVEEWVISSQELSEDQFRHIQRQNK